MNVETASRLRLNVDSKFRIICFPCSCWRTDKLRAGRYSANCGSPRGRMTSTKWSFFLALFPRRMSSIGHTIVNLVGLQVAQVAPVSTVCLSWPRAQDQAESWGAGWLTATSVFSIHHSIHPPVNIWECAVAGKDWRASWTWNSSITHTTLQPFWWRRAFSCAFWMLGVSWSTWETLWNRPAGFCWVMVCGTDLFTWLQEKCSAYIYKAPNMRCRYWHFCQYYVCLRK